MIPTTLQVSPLQATAGSTVTVSWSGIANPTAQDWIGLFAQGVANTNPAAWVYVSCTQTLGGSAASGSCQFVLPATLVSGPYELRLFAADNTSVQLAVSEQLAVSGLAQTPTSTPVVLPTNVPFGVSPTIGAPGDSVTVSWSQLAGAPPTVWFGLYPLGAPDTGGVENAWWYAGTCAQTPGGGRSTGACTLVLPVSVRQGGYELRLFGDRVTSLRLATSNPLTIVPPVDLNVSPAGTVVGATVTVTWSNVPAPTATDWIGLYTRGDRDTFPLLDRYIYASSCGHTPGTARASGSCAFTLPATIQSGTYELRLFASAGNTRLAISPPLFLAPSSTPTQPCSDGNSPPNSDPGWHWSPFGNSGIWWQELSSLTCLPGGVLPPIPDVGSYTYTAEFANGTQGWGTVMLGPDATQLQWSATGGPASGPYVASQAPWWVDTNHKTPNGAGDLHLVSYVYVNQLQPHVHARAVDMRGAIVTAWLRGENVDLAGAHLVFWVQSWPARSLRVVNYALTAQPLDAAVMNGGWTRVTFRLPDDQAQWTCYGAALETADRYGCAPIGDVLADMNGDFGFHLFPLQDYARRYPSGRIGIAQFSLQYQLSDNGRLSPNTPTSTVIVPPTPIVTPTATSTQTTTTLSVSPPNVSAGSTVTAVWNNIATPSAYDWLGLYAQGAADNAYTVDSWLYAGACSQTPSTARAAGSCAFPLPAGLAPGAYELRLFAYNSYQRLAVSPAFGVQTGASLGASPAQVLPGGVVTATWSSIPSPTAYDWLGLYRVGSAETDFVPDAWLFSNCTQTPSTAQAAGSCAFPLPAGLAPGAYELRLFAYNSYQRLAASNTIALVMASATPTVIPTSTSTPTATPMPTATATPPPAATPTSTPPPTAMPTSTPQPTPTSLPAPTATPVNPPAATPCLLGDINCDGIVDIRDYGIWQQNFGRTNCGNAADVTLDCLVDIRDYNVWRQNFGRTAGPAAPGAVPPIALQAGVQLPCGAGSRDAAAGCPRGAPAAIQRYDRHRSIAR